MDLQQATDYVVEALIKQRNRNDIILELCNRTGSSWQQAEKFVEEIESLQRRKIALGSSPLFLVIGLGIMAGGLLLTITTAYSTLHGAVYSFGPIPIPYLGNITRLATGIAMILGSGIGILLALKPILK